MSVHPYRWQWRHQTFRVMYEISGQGQPVLLLPAFSTVSSRSEMQAIATLLSPQYQVVTLDWLGFGDSDRPFLDYQPSLFHQLLQDFVSETFQQPVIIIAAGHAAGYALALAQQLPNAYAQLVLVAPTWRGPLPTMGVSQSLAGVVRGFVRSPLIGQALYSANTTPGFLRLMYRRHVYTDSNKLTTAFITQKRKITQQPGARFAPAAFVTGALDPVHDRTAFLSLFQTLTLPMLVLIAEHAPPKSRAEMDALAKLPGVQAQVLPGTLGLHEEFAPEVTMAIQTFLQRGRN